MDWKQYSEWVSARYAVSYAKVILANSKKYMALMVDVRQLDILKSTIRNNVIKSLIILSKFLGVSEQFHSSLKSHDVKLHKQDALQSFLRIINASDSDILDWYGKAYSVARANEKLYLELLKVTGVRSTEGIYAFNKIIELARDGKLREYYEKNLGCLMHFKYPKLFLRNTKNCYISFRDERLVNEIAHSTPLTYAMIRKRLRRSGLMLRTSELRDYFGTYLLKHGVLEQEINTLQGRIPPSVFVRHYWSPKLAELRDKVLNLQQQPIPISIEQ